MSKEKVVISRVEYQKDDPRYNNTHLYSVSKQFQEEYKKCCSNDGTEFESRMEKLIAWKLYLSLAKRVVASLEDCTEKELIAQLKDEISEEDMHIEVQRGD